MLPMSSELALHAQGTFVAQKLIINVNSPEKFLDVSRSVLPDTVLLMQVRERSGPWFCKPRLLGCPFAPVRLLMIKPTEAMLST
jgi:hypothetical protein